MKKIEKLFGIIAIGLFSTVAFGQITISLPKIGTPKTKTQTNSAATPATTQKKSDYTLVELVANKTVKVEGNLSDGKIIDLGWASRSSTACFPATQNSKFTGNHVIFATSMPANSILTVTVRPKDKSKNLSIYGYQLANDEIILPKDLIRCTSCEAEHKWDYPKRGKSQDESRSISLNSVGGTYTVVVGVAGANDLTAADFTLEFDLKK